MNGWSLTVDRETCIGSGMCLVYAPGTFDQDDEAKVFLIEPSTDGLDEVRAAVEGCPTRSIRLSTEEEAR